MLQFSIAGLLTAAQVIVVERKSAPCSACLPLPRAASTSWRSFSGDFYADFHPVHASDFLWSVHPESGLPARAGSHLLVAFSAALCISALGLLIGVLAHNEEQAVTFSLIPMFVFSGLGGAWVRSK